MRDHVYHEWPYNETNRNVRKMRYHYLHESYLNYTEKVIFQISFINLNDLELAILCDCLFIQVIYTKKSWQNVHVHDKSMYSRMSID